MSETTKKRSAVEVAGEYAIKLIKLSRGKGCPYGNPPPPGQAPDVDIERLPEKMQGKAYAVKRKKPKKGFPKASGAHTAARAIGKGTQAPTPPGITKLESASDTPPKAAPEKKPEPQVSENQADEKVSSYLKGARAMMAKMSVEDGPPRRQRERDEEPEEGRRRRDPQPRGRYTGEESMATRWGLVGTPPERRFEPSQPQPRPKPRRTPRMERPGPDPLGDIGRGFGGIGRGVMGGVQQLLQALGASGAAEQMGTWRKSPTITGATGAGTTVLGAVLLHMLLNQLRSKEASIKFAFEPAGLLTMGRPAAPIKSVAAEIVPTRTGNKGNAREARFDAAYRK
jgi:hypothetical protein